ncbi:hypothetical protein [Mycolicibacterium tusciae]|uniref:Uncharacterized protein n=1 Tax=Mycolicibacterium tusciae TaxID=75922 RepID=A0A1X0JVX7_9MYCO|nr:hypothetical protein [Mycolicibacterium tusciae]ORB66942.1 hypothetical protein BST47_07705 [Mycolicibacterium tusciae]
MAWDWVGPAATAAVGMAGILGTLRGGSKTLAHERTLATEARQQQRLENAYVDLLDVAERTGNWTHMVYPMMDTNPPQPVPPVPSLEEQAHTVALVRAFGSALVLERMYAWRAIVREMVATAEFIAWDEANPGRPRENGERLPRLVLHELRTKEREAREALGDQVASELGHRN